MPITNLTTEQRSALASHTMKILAELWCDQHGIDAVIQIIRRDAAHNLKGDLNESKENQVASDR